MRVKYADCDSERHQTAKETSLIGRSLVFSCVLQRFGFGLGGLGARKVRRRDPDRHPDGNGEVEGHPGHLDRPVGVFLGHRVAAGEEIKREEKQ